MEQNEIWEAVWELRLSLFKTLLHEEGNVQQAREQEDLQPRSSCVLPWCRWLVHTKWAVATSAVTEWKGQSLGKAGGASSMIFKCLNPKS